jgi:hypothetical protein
MNPNNETIEPADLAKAEAELRRTEIVDLAKQENLTNVEIDDDAELSEGDDNGTYVAAWVWVDFAGTKFDKEPEEDDSDNPESRFPIEDWKHDVSNGDTKLGYADWVAHNVESHANEGKSDAQQDGVTTWGEPGNH